MPHIAILACEHSLASSISLPLEMLHAADNFNHLQNRHGERCVTQIVGLNKKPLQTTGGLTIRPDISLDKLEHTDLIIVPALWRNPKPVIQRYQAFIPKLQEMAAQDSFLCAVGTGSCFLAEAGLLDGRAATTHWYYRDQFQKDYPRVLLQHHHLITKAGNIYCAGSVNSVADLMIHFIGLFFGIAISRRVEGHFSPEIRQSVEINLYSQGAVNLHHDEEVVQAQSWLQEHYMEPVTLNSLADALGMNIRTLNRRFKSATGKSPMEYLCQIRINIARDLLKNSNLPVNEIAYRVGYQDSSHFGTTFKKEMFLSPLRYRQNVRGKLFSL